jgi:hypothetical protein
MDRIDSVHDLLCRRESFAESPAANLSREAFTMRFFALQSSLASRNHPPATRRASSRFLRQAEALEERCLLALDYGDAPDSFGTVNASDGAFHTIVESIRLGAALDAEVDGQASADARGDDVANLDDEDGVVLPTSLVIGQVAALTVDASVAGKLDAWIDYNGDGSWAEAGEQVLVSAALTAGPNLLQLNIPATALIGHSFARFRFSTAGGLAPTGAAADGEVEDYLVTIGEPSEQDVPPIANDDHVCIEQGALLVTGNVTVNDQDVDGDAFTVVLVGNTDEGILALNTDGSFTFTPEASFDGQAVFSYRAVDDDGQSEVATVRISTQDYNFVENLYQDLLNRTPGEPEVEFWLDRLEAVPKRDVINGFLASQEYRRKSVNSFYEDLLGRDASNLELSTAISAMAAGSRDETVLAGVVASDEYFTAQGGTNVDFIQAIYQDLLGRAADAAGRQFWTDRLSQGVTRAQVVLGFATSTEFRTLLLDDMSDRFSSLEGWYQDFLNRPADASGRGYFTNQLANGATWAQVQAQLLNSPEYYDCGNLGDETVQSGEDDLGRQHGV